MVELAPIRAAVISKLVSYGYNLQSRLITTGSLEGFVLLDGLRQERTEKKQSYS